MKRLTTYILAVAVILLVLSCKTVDLSKKYPNMVADLDPVSVGTFDAQFDRMFSTKARKTEIEAIFHPRFNYVSLEFKQDLITYRQFWDQAARKQFAASLELYKKDFENRKLSNNNRRTKSVYGKVNGHVEWELSKFTKTHVSYPIIEIGYQFKENTPFFTTFMRSTKETVDKEDDSDATYSQPVTMYFTRAQADVLAGIFDQARLMELIGTQINKIKGEYDEYKDTPTPKANYDEY